MPLINTQGGFGSIPGGGGSAPGAAAHRSWAFDETSGANVNDTSTANQDASLTSSNYNRNQPSIVTSGTGKSTQFTGLSYANIPGTPPFGNVDFDNFSISLWVNFSSFGSENPLYFQGAPFVGSGINCNLWVDNSGNLIFDKDGTGSGITCTTTLLTGTTYHIVYAEGLSTRAFYIDGVEAGSDNAPQTFNGTDAFQALIVANESFPAATLTIQDMKLYTIELSEDNALWLYLNS